MAGTAQQDRLMVGSISPLLALPPELQLYLSRYLDLATLIAYSSHVCKALRSTFASFQRIPLYLVPAHRLSLAEWRKAAIQLRKLGLVHPLHDQESEEGARVGKPLRTLEKVLVLDESQTDLRFLLGVLRCLERPCDAPRMGGTAPGITSLSAVSWHGIAGLDLIRTLDQQPLLSQLQTIVKTERLDHRVWSEAARAVAQDPDGVMPPFMLTHDFRNVPFPNGLRTMPGDEGHNEHAFRYNRCSPSQVIVQVGKRRSAAPGDRRLKGEGLQMGFEGVCLEEAGEEVTLIKEDESTTADESNVDRNDIVIRQRLHVVYQGRFMETKHESVEIDDLFRRSIVTCTNCKQQIAF